MSWEIRRLWRQFLVLRPFFGRAVLCFGLGLVLLAGDLRDNFDTRFRLRGTQPVDSRIVLLDIAQNDWAAFSHPDHLDRMDREDVAAESDLFFDREETWYDLLHRVLAADPAGVGITFYVGDMEEDREEWRDVLRDNRVVWAARTDAEGRTKIPVFAKKLGVASGVVDLRADADGVVRRVSEFSGKARSFSVRLSNLVLNRPGAADKDGAGRFVNFRGGQGTYPAFRYRDILSGKVPASVLKGKIVIVGSQDIPHHRVLTPLGFMGRAEVMANITDGFLNDRWIVHLGFYSYAVYLLAFLILSLWAILTLPQSTATIVLAGISIIVSSISAWVFDTFHFWIPLEAPLIQLAIALVVFLSWQLSFNERKAWRLEQERTNIFELERLKDNFISLISHDLKTPIAKIQAIVERLLSGTKDDALARDLRSLKVSSQDLHRYIHSILQVSRVEARELKLNKVAADFNEVVQKVVDQILTLAEEKGVQLVVDQEPMFAIEMDVPLVSEVVLNLIENAVKYSPRGSRIVVHTSEVDEEVEFSVRDDGPGIPREDQKRIWDKFYRAKEQESTKGSGLGLYLVKYFVEMHYGNVFLESEPGQGTRIGFRLPVLSVEEDVSLEQPMEADHV